jgi:F-type H+-transporting ATPase subunit alpha
MAHVQPAEVSAILKQELAGFRSEAELEEVGTVLQWVTVSPASTA